MKPILIAECCQNHNGDQEILKTMIHKAAENGADYVKIQAIRSKDLAYRERFEEGSVDKDGTITTIKRAYQPELERLAKLDLTLEQELWFVEECKKAGVKPMTTVFTRTAIDEVKNMGYEAIKIASYDCASYPLLEDVKKLWNKIFVSTGSTYDDEIQKAAQILKGTDFEFLHCVTIYPTPLEELHLNRIKFLQQFTPKIGYSDHSKPATTDLWACKVALALGATNIERHYTVLGVTETKDGPVSITPQMLKELRTFADYDNEKQWDLIKSGFPEWEMTLGNSQRQLSHTEILNRDYYRGRFANKIDGKTIYNWED
ncbi:N-acetylneuraminate synthase family protein [Aureibaculum conchae]|uniref:N-acetylneuraminate synthase family protein n=1 Tax=Aureibaculum sp. 2308TA14-22 TaxID=3108392 RepID=UPI0033985107